MGSAGGGCFEVTVPEGGLPRVLGRFGAQECERLPVLAESRFRDRYGLALLVVRRGAAGMLLPDAELRFATGDRLVVFGPRDRIRSVRAHS